MAPDLTQPWYADDYAACGRASQLQKVMAALMARGPARGYFLEPSKSIAFCDAPVREQVRAILDEFSFQYRDGHRYAGGFIVSDASRAVWVEH